MKKPDYRFKKAQPASNPVLFSDKPIDEMTIEEQAACIDEVTKIVYEAKVIYPYVIMYQTPFPGLPDEWLGQWVKITGPGKGELCKGE